MNRPSPDKKIIAELREKIKELEFENELLVETNERVMERNRELRKELENKNSFWNGFNWGFWLVFWMIIGGAIVLAETLYLINK